MPDESLPELEKTIRAIMISTPNNMTADEIGQAYEELMHTKIPCEKYGYPTLDSLLCGFPEVALPVKVINGKIQYKGVANRETQLIANMVTNQRNTSKPTRTSYRTPTANRYRQTTYSSSRESKPTYSSSKPQSYSTATRSLARNENENIYPSKISRVVSSSALIREETQKWVSEDDRLNQTLSAMSLNIKTNDYNFGPANKNIPPKNPLKKEEPLRETGAVNAMSLNTKTNIHEWGQANQNITQKVQLKKEEPLSETEAVKDFRRKSLAILKLHPNGVSLINFLASYEQNFHEHLEYSAYGASNYPDLFQEHAYDFMEVDFNKDHMNPQLRKKCLPPYVVRRK
ncbi:hypothetical protein RF11_13990 [Thelohanellus kitauei]|uniref:HTH OST-type domain-containing protein n=1 Tax=Thelohanellus kitauei TaxID=669202 RepID=A0A0C2MH85_THEKT|nr:hypothetical protein RF11_13990 [Thelohanellus kitauei]